MIIRQLAASFSGVVIAAGEFERAVHIWDLTPIHLASFETILDFGGRRLAITGDGKQCIAAAYRFDGVAAYSTFDGAKIWHRRDLKNTQCVKVSVDDRHIGCIDEKSCQFLDRETGETVKKWPDVWNIWESPYESVVVLETGALVFQTQTEQVIATVAREEYAVLSAAFAPGLACVSESGGPLRCLEADSGKELWRYAQKGQHILELAYAETAKAFVGIGWSYELGGSHRLLRIEPRSGKLSEVSDLGPSGEFAFCQRGSRVLSSDGSLIDSVTGNRVATLAFPNLQRGAP
jgi:outer membrane protein assembly factor BamB